ncbi:type II secretion system F family protein [Serratia ureilytica]
MEGLNAAALAADHLLYRQALEQVRQLAEGEAFHHALALQPLFPPLCRQLVRVGEESGSLDVLLDKWRSGMNGRRTSWPIRWRKRWSRC